MIAAVDGLAIGVGTTMLLHCDLVYATPAASLRTPFLDLGLIQEAGSSITAPARLGYPRAFELVCLGEPFSAERALQAGLINAIVPAAELEATALKAARRLAAKPRQALLTSRRLLRATPRHQRHDRGGSQQLHQADGFASRPAFTAFLETPTGFAKARAKNG
jgi:enoyl-CoA hydratase/carnithine racemase